MLQLSIRARAVLFGMLAVSVTANGQAPKYTRRETNKPALAAPLPDAATIKQRVLENLKAMRAERERYLCHVVNHGEETDKNGKVKKSVERTYDMFYVNGREIDQLVSKNGKPLDAGQQKKESERVQKEIAKNSDEKHLAKAEAEDEKQLDILLHALKFTDGHRQMVNGRSTLYYDLIGDPVFHPKGAGETFLHNMAGAIAVDEETGQLVELNAHLDHDVKIGGGLIANVHKGAWMHVHQVRQPDGVWINDLSEGKGDARAALFLHPYFQFRQPIDGCKLTDVTTQTSAPSVAVK